ncbi:MAG TPA: TIGR03087 family PEP-CTERM/XrtA system glycosyltransferase [Candidatus Binatia bacterium]|nr:TIGR03087 family PEP-CTERM/XrtA system glycosyltransferase [Candidatus Binatia bacterium]
MRILFLVHRTPYPPNKGEKIRALWELRELSRKHDVDLFCFYDDADDEKYSRELKKYCRRYHSQKLSWFWSRARALRALAAGQCFTRSFFFSPAMARRINLAVRARSYDRVLVYSAAMAQYVENAQNVPRILDLVDVDSDKWRQYAEKKTWPLSLIWEHEAKQLAEYEAFLVRTFSATAVCTLAEARLLRKNARSGRIEVLQNCVQVSEDEAGRNTHDLSSLQPYVLFSGSMDYFPNVDAVEYFYREVFPLILQEVPGARFVVAGRNPARSILSLRSDPAVRVTGNLKSMRPYICGAAVAVAPMRIARGVQNKILEALAAGTPVVCSKAAATALDPQVRDLVNIADTPHEYSRAIVNIMRAGPAITPHALRVRFKRYVDDLDLAAQFEDLITAPEPQHESVGVGGS